MTKDTLAEAINLVANATITLLRDKFENREPAIQRWDWPPGVGLYGLIRAYEALGRQDYLDYSKHYVDRLLDAAHVSYSINGSVVFATVLKLYEHTGEERYRTELRYFLRWLLSSAPRCQNDSFEHSWTNTKAHLTEQVWIDTLFMAGIVLADSYRVLVREDCRAEAVRQFVAHQTCLQDADTGLYYHLYNGVTDSHMAGAFWARGNGWMAASLLDVVDAIGRDNPEHRAIVSSFQRQMNAVRALQTADGAFHTILDDPNTYVEMSATAALGYAALKAVRVGLLDETFRSLGARATQAVLAHITPDGIVGQVSSGTSGFIAYEDYNQIPIAPQLWGQGLAMLLMIEQLRLEQERRG
jgi:unsaturated rhamnogalacturonyl hydrolase